MTAFIAWGWFNKALDTPLTMASDSYRLVVAKGSNLSRLARQLMDEGLTENELPLAVYGRCCVDAPIHAGEYLVANGQTLRQLVERLIAGDVVQYSITFPEGKTLNQWLEIIQRHEVLGLSRAPEWDSLLEIVLANGVEVASPEGWFFPDTYRFSRNDSAVTILQLAHKKMHRVLMDEWQTKREGLPLASPYEALILASIVEKETGLAEERGTIAGVFIRRLEKKMRLQTDPTVIYGLGAEFDGNLTRRHLRQDNPYNTYQIDGLPPTPIANPGVEAIRASLHPEDGTALYFVARGDGSHQFSATLAQHQRAVREFQLNRKKNYRSSPATQ
jgi:UPF0755 protein